jgi:site-specific DNA recombinase
MNCLTYARVSTDKQAEKELSIPAQLQAMHQYAADRGWTIVQEFTEAGASARTANRPVLRQLLGRCAVEGPAKADVVLVHKLDRLARNLADHIAIRAQLRQRGVTVASVTESLEDSVSGQLVEHILAAMAEFYSANLSEEVKKGMRQKVLQGGWPHRTPRGYRIVRYAEKSTVAIDEVQAPLVRSAFEMCLNGYRGLVDLRWRLAALGLRTEGGEPVSNGYLGRMLRNPFYCGRLSWNDQVYPGAHPPLVSSEVFEGVQRVLASRTRPLTKAKATFLLNGIAQCSQCGTLVGSDVHRRWRYYRCRRSFRSSGRCRTPYINMERAHRSLERILRMVSVPDSLGRELVQETAFEPDRTKWLGLLMNQSGSAWDVLVALPLPGQRKLLEGLFERLEMDATGIARFDLKAPAPAISPRVAA